MKSERQSKLEKFSSEMLMSNIRLSMDALAEKKNEKNRIAAEIEKKTLEIQELQSQHARLQNEFHELAALTNEAIDVIKERRGEK